MQKFVYLKFAYDSRTIRQHVLTGTNFVEKYHCQQDRCKMGRLLLLLAVA